MDREPSEWINEEGKFNSLRSEISSSIDLLNYSGCLDKVLIWWVRREVLKELGLIKQELEFNDLSLSDQLICWSKIEWGHRLNEIFLEKKNYLDLVSFNILKIENHAVAQELYHRLKEGESSFSALAPKFSIDSEKNKNPLKHNVRMGSLPHGLQNVIRSLRMGQISKPLQLNNHFVLIRLEELKGAEMSDEIQNKLALDQFNVWASSVAQVARGRLM